ncbi:MAG: hypothetical protein ACI4XL_04865 [Bacillus sp. (in: firmicutes)]
MSLFKAVFANLVAYEEVGSRLLAFRGAGGEQKSESLVLLFGKSCLRRHE